MKTIHIGILGYGTVGTGTAKLLLEQADLLTARTGIKLQLKAIADKDTQRDRGLDLKDTILTDDAMNVVKDPEIDIVVELIGGTTFAKEIIVEALKNGKHVVTANKALLAHFGNELVALSKSCGKELLFEASCGGCMPIIKNLREALAANEIKSMYGILNGTCNYILSKITKDGSPFDQALKKAQELGFAEADPTLDIEGFDTAHKLAILNSLAYGMEINLSDIHVEGISKITPEDIALADSFGYAIKLLAIGKIHDNHVEARVHPTLIPKNNPLSHVDLSMNAIAVDAHATGKTMLYGHGAGMMPTASAILSDIVDIARNMAHEANFRVPTLGFTKDAGVIPILPMSELYTRYYLRFEVQDSPGILAKIAGILGENQISIESVHQKGPVFDSKVPVVMITHMAKEACIRKALTEISAMDLLTDEPMLIRIEEETEEI